MRANQCALCGAFLPRFPHGGGVVNCGKCGTQIEVPPPDPRQPTAREAASLRYQARVLQRTIDEAMHEGDAAEKLRLLGKVTSVATSLVESIDDFTSADMVELRSVS